MKNPVTLMLCCLLAVGAGAHENDVCNPDAYAAVGKSLKLPTLTPDKVVSASCRTWPYKPDLLLAVFAWDEGVEYEKKQLVAIIDKKSRSVVSSFQDVIEEDAVTEVGGNSLSLDTARYQLSDKIRAFGIRFNSAARGASCGEAYWGDELTLFVPEGKVLRPVITLNLYQQRWHQGCPVATSAARWDDATLTVGIAKSATNGFHDLEITAKISRNDIRSEVDEPGLIERHTLKYDGKRYDKNNKLAPWWLGF